MNELDQLRAEAEQLKNAIRVSLSYCLHISAKQDVSMNMASGDLLLYFGAT